MEETQAKAPDPGRGRVVVPRKGDVLTRLTKDDASRKTFLKLVGGAGAAGAFSVLLAACGEEEGDGGGAQTQEEEQPTANAQQVLDVFNYALTLEFLEAKFYRDVIEAGVIEDQQIASVAQTFGEHEQEHVDALIQAIEQMGGEPADDPNGDFSSVIQAGEREVLVTAAMVENLGAGAYLDQAPLLQESDEALAAALSIHTVEARHAAALNTVAGFEFTGKALQGSIPDGAFAEPIDKQTVMETIQPFLGGGNGGGGNGGGGN